MVILAILFSSFSMYLFAKEFWGKFGSVLSSALYVFAPYHAVDLYVRGDFAEAWAYSFIPLIFYGLWKIHKERKWKYVVITSLAFGLTILSHNLTALMVSPFLILFERIVNPNADRKSTRLNSSHQIISYPVFSL